MTRHQDKTRIKQTGILLGIVSWIALAGVLFVYCTGCDTTTRIKYGADGSIEYTSSVPLFAKRTLAKADLHAGTTTRPFNLSINGFTNELSPEAKEVLKAGIEGAVNAALNLK